MASSTILCYFIDLNILQKAKESFPLGRITLLQKNRSLFPALLPLSIPEFKAEITVEDLTLYHNFSVTV